MLVDVAQNLLLLTDTSAERIEWEWVRGHSDSQGNENAGRLAGLGERGNWSGNTGRLGTLSVRACGQNGGILINRHGVDPN